VAPLTPLRDISLQECAVLAREIGHDIARDLHLPVYFYEASASPGKLTSLPEIRAGGFEGLFRAPLQAARAPDAGPPHAHPTAGAVIVGARGPLVAYNIDLAGLDVDLSRRIAGAIRRARSAVRELAGVRALGLSLPRRGCAQVSMNVTLPHETPLGPIFDFIRDLAELSGIAIRGSEIVGLVPQACVGDDPDRILWHGHRETQIVEFWLSAL
jgi:glutamate formiminotransferase